MGRKAFGRVGNSGDRINALSGSGLISLDDIYYYKKTGIYPEFLGSVFPQVYVDLALSFDHIALIRETDGRTGIENAVIAAGSGGTAILIMPGTYTGEAYIKPAGSTSSCFHDRGKPISFICAPGQTIFEYTRSQRDLSAFMFNDATSAVYGAYIKRNNNNATDNFSVAWGRGTDGANNLGSAYNCVLREMNANGNWARQYGGGSHSFNNCLIYAIEDALADYNSSLTVSWDYCACNYTYTTATTPWTNGAVNQTVNSDFSLDGNSSAGVYSGTYAWDSSLVTVSTSS